MLIRVDTREQNPLQFERCAAIRGTIGTFDYAIEGDQDFFAIERKSLPDLIQSLAIQKNWIRELKKIRRARAAGFPRLFYVIESNREDIEHFNYSIFTRGRIGAAFIFHQLSELEYIHDVHVVFAGDALGAARDVYRILKRRSEDLKQQEGDAQ
jgi:ERCC4-type nuclease